MRVIYKELVKIPTHALCYLINGDDSALTDEDKGTIDNWWDSQRCYFAEEFSGSRIDLCSSESDEEYFTSSPAFGLPCTVCNYYILVME